MGRIKDAQRVYREKVIEELENRFSRWAEKKGYNSVSDVKRDLKIRNERVYEKINYIHLISNIGKLKISTAKDMGIGYIIEAEIDSISYIKQKAIWQVDVMEFLKNRVFEGSDED